MNENTTTPVVVVTEEKKRRTGLMWIAGGAALLLGGSTFALWSATDGFSGGTITSGNLNLVQGADTTFWDVSADRLDATEIVPGTDGSQPGHALDPSDASTWRIVPGDKVAATFSADVTLEGDNLVGKLTLDGLGGQALSNTGMTYTYEVYKAGQLIGVEAPLPTVDDAGLVYLSAPGTGQDNGMEDADGTTVLPMIDITEDFTVVIYGEFDANTEARDQANVVDALDDMVLRLEQVRDTGAQFS